ncbi:regulator of sigma E protease [Hymenobacter luteus]|uniref:Regulator of sigma E protease n=2 Tax=Hymenobacter TaxID=89966 RepID=A0A7W9SYM3_9BACT|nr:MULTISPECIES: site-2 protease family protein [Hymenobacter]MBB4600312.1 regulator of sigma E protease [Hymenobacter latericoloratus]MBB6057378.1 regulator of sigma E protease [Hymenobacter luteus]
MEELIMAGQMLLGLSILVGLHEFGHFAAAKYFKIRVDKFYIFFDFLFPLPGVMNFALFKKKVGETEYGLGWFPLGGYVAIHGMIDETQDADSLAAEPQPNEFRAKPAWQRLIVMLGGIIMNVITGIVIFSLITFKYGESYLPLSEVRYGVDVSELGKKIGFQRGDKIVKINGQPFTDFEDIYSVDALLGTNAYYTVDRNGQIVDIPVPNNFMDDLADAKERFVTPLIAFKIEQVVINTPAAKAGLQANDKILKVGNQAVPFFSDLQKALKANANKVEHPSLLQRFLNWIRGVKPKRLTSNATPLLVERAGKQLTLPVMVDEDGRIGFAPKLLIKDGVHRYGFVESIGVGTKQAFGVVTTQIAGFKKIFSGEASLSKSLGGPVEIAQQYGGQWDWFRFWTLTGMLSMVLAFMNLLPIPALDGGHVVFLLYEMIAGRKPSDKFLENAQKVGMLLILSLMAYVLVIKQIINAIG